MRIIVRILQRGRKRQPRIRTDIHIELCGTVLPHRHQLAGRQEIRQCPVGGYPYSPAVSERGVYLPVRIEKGTDLEPQADIVSAVPLQIAVAHGILAKIETVSHLSPVASSRGVHLARELHIGKQAGLVLSGRGGYVVVSLGALVGIAGKDVALHVLGDIEVEGNQGRLPHGRVVIALYHVRGRLRTSGASEGAQHAVGLPDMQPHIAEIVRIASVQSAVVDSKGHLGEKPVAFDTYTLAGAERDSPQLAGERYSEGADVRKGLAAEIGSQASSVETVYHVRKAGGIRGETASHGL